MYYLLYASVATIPFSPAELQELLKISRANNSQLGITGILLYRDGEFMQAIEGEQAAIQALYTHITCDTRHQRITTILEGPIDTRHFPDWSMGYRDLTDLVQASSPDSTLLPGARLDIDELTRNGPLYQRLLQSFRYDV
jgi:Sensors of blue-light using FAD